MSFATLHLSTPGTRLLAAALVLSPVVAPPAAQAVTQPLERSLSSTSDADCLALAIYYEARSETEAGQQAVAQVVLNRVRDRAYPDDVCAVVFQGSERRTGCQFSFTCDGSMARLPEGRAWTMAREIASAALAGRSGSPVGEATHYHTRAIQPYWSSSLTRVATIGAHIFYTRPRAVPPSRMTFERVERVVLAATDDADGEGDGRVAINVHRGRSGGSR